jgi:hypothetical protein
MKKLFLLAVTLASIITLQAQAAQPGPADGFREYSWGGEVSEDMVATGVNVSGMAGFMRRNDVDEFAGHRNSFIAYFFHDNRLCRVVVAWPVTVAFDTLNSALTTAWGSPDRSATDEQAWLSGSGQTIAVLHRSGPQSARTSQLTISERRCVERAVGELARR